MKTQTLFKTFATLTALGTAAAAYAVDFAPPLMMQANGQPISTESPGYAAPCWADVDGDGKKDLLVGQFAGGKIQVFKNTGDNKLAAGQWLQADGKTAKVPGVW